HTVCSASFFVLAPVWIIVQTLRVECRSERSASGLECAVQRRASPNAFRRWSVRNDNLNYRAALRVACRSGRSASGLECAVQRRVVTQSVTQRI
ncbi:hypothetical protein ALQ95_01958, partial [Pseudomonas syringae pv. ribicola]